MEETFREPILSQFLNIVGGIVLVVGVLVTVVGIVTLAGWMGPTILFVSTVLVSLLIFGTAQVITYLGRTAYHVQRIHELLLLHCREEATRS